MNAYQALQVPSAAYLTLYSRNLTSLSLLPGGSANAPLDCSLVLLELWASDGLAATLPRGFPLPTGCSWSANISDSSGTFFIYFAARNGPMPGTTYEVALNAGLGLNDQLQSPLAALILIAGDGVTALQYGMLTASRSVFQPSYATSTGLDGTLPQLTSFSIVGGDFASSADIQFQILGGISPQNFIGGNDVVRVFLYPLTKWSTDRYRLSLVFIAQDRRFDSH